MISRKILINIFASFIVLQLFINFNYVCSIIKGNYKYFDTTYINIKEYLEVTIFTFGNLIVSILSLILVFLPFQIIKDHYYNKGHKLTFIKKWLIIFALIFIWSFIWRGSLIFNILSILIMIATALFFNILLYLLIDKYAEKSKSDKIQF
ncbi:hypothetical protein CMT87_17035 [Elizabethkingia anophelis]|nr:hypothetical protein FF18_07960 [Elizabethkingia anophelis]MDV3501011.1 hypothetical protein [Elizabethkingia anophelis]PKR33135.1 hypothetical protein CWH99_01395 [Elizabethkingia anophelis]PKR35342.1 hypothetical protein CWI00_11905 [Elizabethkingia anophelis]PRQ81161.1 hypothetical protein CMT60_03610 [Elizabethkingia anophelis]